jgi:aryl-alcohol dehydrogenase-like predicted oxidoreductase
MRELGRTGMRVSALGLGTVKFGRNTGLRYPRPFELPSDNSAARLLDRASDLGINLLDTAPAYGESEERLGRLLSTRRERWLVCSKVGEEYAHGRSRYDFSPGHTRRSVERSLQRLGIDALDLVLVHCNGEDEYIIKHMGTLEALAELRGKGLVRAIGMSTKSVAGGVLAASHCDAVMLTYNLERREEAAVLDACAASGCAALVKKALASGHVPETGADDFLRRSMQLVFAHPATSSAIVGTLCGAHLEADVRAAREALQAIRR